MTTKMCVRRFGGSFARWATTSASSRRRRTYEACPAAADCLIVDLRLPGLNGFELRDRLRLRGSLIPIVFITGDGGPSPGDTLAHAGTPSLAKPFNDSDLLAAITRAVSNSAVIQ